MNVIITFGLLRAASGEQCLIRKGTTRVAGMIVSGPQHTAELGDYSRKKRGRCCDDDTYSWGVHIYTITHVLAHRRPIG